MQAQETLGKILEQFKQECRQRQIKLCPDFAHFYLHLLARDAREGLDLRRLTTCKTQNFIDKALSKYASSTEPLANNMKLTFYSDRSQELQLEAVRIKYATKFQNELQQLIDGILQYPETSNKEQIEQMFTKMQIFIVTNYNIGCPKNHVLLKQTRQSLNSVIGRGDLQNYVLKKKHHRLEYLQRLGATVCGILIYNNHGPAGDKENTRDILFDLEMAQQNTKEALNNALKHCLHYRKTGFSTMEEIIHIDVKAKLAHFQWPLEKVHEINRFIALFGVYERSLHRLIDSFQKTEYLIETAGAKMCCVIKKIDNVLKYRTAIESELIFPHFVYLSEVWSSLVLYLNHLSEINRIKDQMDSHVSAEVEANFADLIQTMQAITTAQMKYPIEPSFEELITRSMKRTAKGSILKIGNDLQNYCALTIALTGGILVPARVHKKLCEDFNLKFGFSDIELAKYAERNFEDFLRMLQNVIFSSADLILLFGLHDEILRQDIEDAFVAPKENTRSFETQTEMIATNDLSVSNRINTTWNVWDYHRETIRLANLRRRQTHSAQTAVTYGHRNAQNQAHSCRRDV